MAKFKTNDEMQFRIAREYFFSKGTFRSVGEQYQVEESSVRRFYIRWLRGIYRDFIHGTDQEKLESRYDMDTPSLYKCLREAERHLHIGVCHSRVIMKGGVLCVK